MFENIYNYRKQLIAFITIESIISFVLAFILPSWQLLILAISLGLIIVSVIIVFYMTIKDVESTRIHISQIIGKDADQALAFGKIGIILYDENKRIIWVNDYLTTYDKELIDQPISKWIENIESIDGKENAIKIKVDDYTFSVYGQKTDGLIFVKDITLLETLDYNYRLEQTVFAYITVDNYDEVALRLDEQENAVMTSLIRQIISDWAQHYGILIRRYRGENYIAVMNEVIYQELLKDKFSIMVQIRKQTEHLGTSLTLSMGIARKDKSLLNLEDMASTALDLALGRGGDQIAVKTYGEEIHYYGGSTDSNVRYSKVRARVVGQNLRKMILDSERVIITGHKMSDFDSVGGSLGLMRIALAYKKPTYVVIDPDSIESRVGDAVNEMMKNDIYNELIVHPNQAMQLMNDQTLVIVADNHQANMCLEPRLVESAKKLIIIDHHRRNENYIDKAEIAYIEPSASSTSELVVELFAYQSERVFLKEEEATLMLDGIIVDTNFFKVRTGTRTFEAASVLKNMGANVLKAHELLQEDYDQIKVKSSIIQNAYHYKDNIVIAKANDDMIVTQAMLAQVANTLLDTKKVEACFIIGRINDETVSVSARSKTKINVQMIMERLGGGGHFGLAATRREGVDTDIMEGMLIDVIDTYLKERADEDEGNSTE